MSIKSLLRQTLTIYTKSSYNAEGREVVGSGIDYDCRFQAVTKQRLLPNGSLITIAGIAYVEPTVTVNVDDRVSYDSIQYKVYGVYETPGGDGQSKLIKLELIKWRQT